MTTIVASPPTFTSLPRLSWDGPSSSNSGGFSAMSNDDVSRMFMPQRKAVTRSASSSSLASNSSNASTTTVTAANDATPTTNGENTAPAKKKQRGGFWPVSKAESTSSISNARANGAVQPTASNGVNALGHKNGLQPAVPEHGNSTANGVTQRSQNPAMLVLLPMNGTFERKQINVPIHPDPPQKIGRQTNNKTTPKPDNGYFDSKVLSRQHAEIWADASGRIWIRDVKSSNGTFINGTRLSPENRESEPTELRQHDSLELGIDIVSEDQKTIVHHKVSAKVEFAGFPGKAGNALDLLNFGELDPSQGSPMLSPLTGPMHARNQPARPLNGRASVASSVAGGNLSSVVQRQANYWGTPLNIEQLVKQVGAEMRAAKQQAQDLDSAKQLLTSIATSDGTSNKSSPQGKENSLPTKQSNPRMKPLRVDHSARFGGPAAPPPQLPLPEKPDVKTPQLKQETTAKSLTNGAASSPSPTGPQSSEILTLLNSLKEAQRQIESQGSKVKELEDMLRQERRMREAAEEKVKKLEESTSTQPVTNLEMEPTVESEPLGKEEQDLPQNVGETETQLQYRIDAMLSEMQLMQNSLDQTTKRAETAETERASLADMIDRYRKEREEQDAKTTAIRSVDQGEAVSEHESGFRQSANDTGQHHHTNGHVRAPKLPEHLQHAVTTVLQQQQMDGEVPAHMAPYVSMMGIVLIGVGIMAYLNSWQKVDK